MALLLSYIQHLSFEIWNYSVWNSWENGHLSSGITKSWSANQSDAKLLEGGVTEPRFSPYYSGALQGPFYLHSLPLIPERISNYINDKEWDEITCPFPNFNGATIEFWEWISNFISHFLHVW